MFNSNNIKQILIISGGFLCYLMADGCTFSVGILYTEFVNVFHQSKASTAILPGLIYAIPQFSGLIVCPLIDTIGSAYGAIIGGLILFISFFVSRFVVNFQLMYLTLGFCASIGLQMTYVSGIMAVTKEFADKKFLGFALGITVSGSGIGVFIFNPLLNYLLNEFNWPGTLTIESAIFLNIIVAGCLFRLSSKILIVPESKLAITLKEQIPRIQIEVVPYLTNEHFVVRQMSLSHSAEALDAIKEYRRDINNIQVHSKDYLTSDGDSKSSVFLAKNHSRTLEPFCKPISVQKRASSLDRRINEGFHVQLPVDEHVASFVRRLSLYSTNHIVGDSSRIEGSDNICPAIGSSVPNLTTTNLEEIRSTNKSTVKLNCDIHIPSIQRDVLLSSSKMFLTALKRSMMSIMSVKVWTNPNLLLFYLSTLLFSISVVVVWTFSFNHSINMKVNEINAAMLVSVVGIGSCIGQIIFGYISDFMPSSTLYLIGCTVAGLVTIILKYVSSYPWLMALHFLFGFCQGVNYALFSVILVHYSSVDLYPASLAIFLMFSGSGNLIGTSFAGYLNDLTGNYGVAYISNGILLILSGIIVSPLIRAWHKYDRRT